MSYSGWTPERKAAQDERLANDLAAQEAHKARVLEQNAILYSIRPQTHNPLYAPAAHGEIARRSPLKRVRGEEADKLLPVSDSGEAAPSSSKRRKVDSNAAQPVTSRLTKKGVRFHPNAVDNTGSAEIYKTEQIKHDAEANKDHVSVGSGVQESLMGYTPEEMAELWAILLAPTEPLSQPPAVPAVPKIVVEPPTPEASSSRQTAQQKGKPSVKYDTVIDFTDCAPAGGEVDEECWGKGWSEESSDDEVELLDNFGTAREEQAMLIAHPGVTRPAAKVNVQKPVVDLKGKGKARAEPPTKIHSSNATKAKTPQAKPSGRNRNPPRPEEDGTMYKRILLAVFCKLSEEDGRLALHAYKQLMQLQYLRAYQAGLQASYQGI